jgi:hypothetical protein
MVLPVEQFPILSFAQNNPELAGMQMMRNIQQQGLRNQMLRQQAQVQPQQLQDAMRAQELKNQMLGQQAEINPQMLQAQLALAQARTPALQAQTAMTQGLKTLL